MEIGKLNQRILVLENHVKKDAIGNHKAQWEEVFSLWASVTVGNTQGSAAEDGKVIVIRDGGELKESSGVEVDEPVATNV